MLSGGDKLLQGVDLAWLISSDYFLDFAVHKDSQFIVFDNDATAFLVNTLDDLPGVIPHLVSMMHV
jgi:hypothetical protein